MSELHPPRRREDMDLSIFGPSHVKIYQETKGATGYIWNDAPILLLTTRGHKSGQQRTTPLIFVHGEGDAVAIVASKGGAPEHPDWYLNLEAEPHVQVQVKGDIYKATARTAEGAERERLWAEAVKAWPQYADYQTLTDRKIPVVVLDRARH